MWYLGVDINKMLNHVFQINSSISQQGKWGDYIQYTYLKKKLENWYYISYWNMHSKLNAQCSNLFANNCEKFISFILCQVIQMYQIWNWRNVSVVSLTLSTSWKESVKFKKLFSGSTCGSNFEWEICSTWCTWRL